MSGDKIPPPPYAFMSCIGGKSTFTVYPCVSVHSSNDFDKRTYLSRHQSITNSQHSTSTQCHSWRKTLITQSTALHESPTESAPCRCPSECVPTCCTYVLQQIIILFLTPASTGSYSYWACKEHQHRVWSTYLTKFVLSGRFLKFYERRIRRTTDTAVQYLGQLRILQSKA